MYYHHYYKMLEV